LHGIPFIRFIKLERERDVYKNEDLIGVAGVDEHLVAGRLWIASGYSGNCLGADDRARDECARDSCTVSN
jgi:hypothetical protein